MKGLQESDSVAALPALANGACADSGHLEQTVLVILRFPPEGQPGALTPAEEAHINQQLDAASNFLWTNSNQSLQVQFHILKMMGTLQADDYQTYGSSGAAAKYTHGIDESLHRRRIKVEQYAGLIMIYRPTNAPSGLFNNTWIWFNDSISDAKSNPGFSSVVFNSTDFLSEATVHEYLHQLDHRFQFEAGNPDPAQHGFMNPDDLNQPAGRLLAALLGTPPPFPTPVDYYKAMLKFYVGADNNLHPVNYRWLEGIRGAFYGDEAKQVYEFERADDALINAGGDILTKVQPGNPFSFWFRATPGHTAAFRTQTASGHYIFKSVAFNYEIAPGDYTFQVLLVYCDNKGVVTQQRIDDGIYTLGRQRFQSNRKVVAVNKEVDNFQTVFRKGNQLTGQAANDDWLLLGNIVLELAPAP
jgi:hypothetical protein